MSNGTNWELYDSVLRTMRGSSRQQTICSAVNSFSDLAVTNPAFQASATRNGSVQPILAQRTETNICKISILPNDTMDIGDIVECYNEHWIVVEMYTDEYGLSTGVMWLCNYELAFQNGTPDVVRTYCVIDDGSYSKASEKSIMTTDVQYTIYLPLNKDTEKIYVDKRFGIGVVYNQHNEQILQVIKTTWIDKINQNYGEGSHLLKLRASADLYNAEYDNLDKMICDYISENNVPTPEPAEPTDVLLSCVIDGKDTIRMGSKRSYTVSVVDKNGNTQETTSNFIWEVEGEIPFELTTDNTSCTIKVPFDESFIGLTLTLSVHDEENLYNECDKVIEVVTIG